MAVATLTAGADAGKSLSFVPTGPIPGLVSHPSLTPDAQVQILSAVDHAGSATVGDVVHNLPGHPAPVTAVTALVAAGVLSFQPVDFVDEFTVVSRSARRSDTREPEPVAVELPPPPAPPLPDGVSLLPGSPLKPAVHVIDGKMRSMARSVDALQRPGVYIAWSADRRWAYVGYGEKVGNRVAASNHLTHGPDHIAVIVDVGDLLTTRLAAALERILHALVVHSFEFASLNDFPAGSAVGAAEYDRLRMFIIEASATLREAGILFTDKPLRDVAAGPEVLFDTPIVKSVPADAPVHELTGVGVMARAAETDRGWVLLAGSAVRKVCVESASSTASMRRAEWAFSGILRDTGDAYLLMQNLRFRSGSAAAHFVTGSKGRGLAGWIPVPTSTAASPDQPPLTH